MNKSELPRQKKKYWRKRYIKAMELLKKSPYQHYIKYCFYYHEGKEVICTTIYSEEEFNRRTREDDW